MGGLIFLVSIRKTSVSGLLNVAVIQWCLQPCAVQLNLGYVRGNMERTDPGAKCFHEHSVKPDVLYISLPLLGAVAKSSI